MLGRATDYAANNAQPLIEAAMMDDRRQLTEQIGLASNAVPWPAKHKQQHVRSQPGHRKSWLHDRRSRTAQILWTV